MYFLCACFYIRYQHISSYIQRWQELDICEPERDISRFCKCIDSMTLVLLNSNFEIYLWFINFDFYNVLNRLRQTVYLFCFKFCLLHLALKTFIHSFTHGMGIVSLHLHFPLELFNFPSFCMSYSMSGWQVATWLPDPRCVLFLLPHTLLS